MDLPKNAFKAALAAGRPQLGLWCTIDDGSTAEMLAGTGFDWMMFDTEHSAMGPAQILPLLQAVAPYPTSAVVRPGKLDAAEIKKLLDLGAQTLLVPMIGNAEEARAAAAAVDYPPRGIRGVSGMTRASRFAAVPGYHARARDEICLIVQAETLEAIEDLEAICAVEGVDAVFVGPADLAAAMGFPGEPNRPEVQAACAEAIARIRAAGKPAGCLSASPEFLDAMLAAGSLFTAVGVDMGLLRGAAMQTAARWRERLGVGE